MFHYAYFIVYNEKTYFTGPLSRVIVNTKQ